MFVSSLPLRTTLLLLLLGLLPLSSSLLPSRLHFSRYAHDSRPLHVGKSFEGEASASAATAILDVNTNSNYDATKPPRMVPLSQPPLLLLQSSHPIISSEGCSLISQYFDHLTSESDGAESDQLDKRQMQMAETLLDDIHDIIDKVTNCPRHDGETGARYVRYDSKTVIDESILLDSKRFGDTLLPDGLHVDTNNSRLFRHITAILYLTDSQDGFSMDNNDAFVVGGGTTFPLAVPLTTENRRYERNNLHDAGRNLLERGVQHTTGDVDKNASTDGRVLEKAALDVFCRENAKELRCLDMQYNHVFSNSHLDGVRVMPGAGKLIYFHNVDDDGNPDPHSFHGGEELITMLPYQQNSNSDAPRFAANAKTKSILVFFKEISLESFWDRGQEGFAEEARKSRTSTKEMYL
ncbi:hypothetical protein ACHAXR_007580 [Thalassiosira sp. AJA248-18]